MPCVELRINPEEAWEPKRGLLGLPIELRNMIYEMVLIEPPRWERRHKATCEWCPRNTKTFERPVFDHWVNHSGCGCVGCRVLKRVCNCDRRNHWLLCVNRQIHRETARLFWTRNIFCFSTAQDFVTGVGENLRERYVQMLQHVSIMGVHWQEYQQVVWPDCVYHWGDQTGSLAMWTTLKRCSGLKTLEVGPEKVYCPEWNHGGDDDDDNDDYNNGEENCYDYTFQIQDIRGHLPVLKELAFSRMLVYDGNPETSRRNMGWYNTPRMEKRHLLYVKARKVISLNDICTAAKAKEAARSFRTNYMVHVEFAIETSLLGLPEANFSTGTRLDQPFKYAFTQDLNETNINFELKLRDKSTTQVRLLGLPITKRTHLRNIRERWKEDARRKKAGKPLLGAVKADALVKVRKTTKKDEAEDKLEKSRRLELERRASNNQQKERDEARDERRGKREERVELKETAKVNEFIRKLERKRVPRPK